MNSYYDAWFSFLKPKDHLDIQRTSELTGLNEETLELYKGFVQNHWKGALKKMFPRLRDVYPIDWDEVFREYYDLYPPSAWDMNEMTYSIPKFLEDKGFDQYLVELTKYEVLEFQVYKSPGIKSLDKESLKLNPTMSLSMFNYKIAQWVKMMDQDENYYQSLPQSGQNILGVCRDFDTHMCRFTELGKIEVAILEIVKQVPIGKENKVQELREALAHFEIEAEHKRVEEALNLLESQQLIY